MVRFGTVMDVFVDANNNCGYVAFATTNEAKAAKNALDLQTFVTEKQRK